MPPRCFCLSYLGLADVAYVFLTPVTGRDDPLIFSLAVRNLRTARRGRARGAEALLFQWSPIVSSQPHNYGREVLVAALVACHWPSVGNSCVLVTC